MRIRGVVDLSSPRTHWILLALLPIIIFLLPGVFHGRSIFLSPWGDLAPTEFMSKPLWNLFLKAFHQGEFPLWNPYNGAGAPLAADIAGGLYSPFNWISFLGSNSWMWATMYVLRFIVSGWGLYLLLLELQVSTWIAFLLALNFMFNGHFVIFGNLWHMNTLALVPYFFVGLLRIFSSRPRSGFALTSLSVTLMTLGAGLMDLTFAGFVGICLVVFLTASELKTNSKIALVHAALCLAAVILGFGMSSIYFLPLLEMRMMATPMWGPRSAYVFDHPSLISATFFSRLWFEPAQLKTWYMRFRQTASPFVLLGVCFALANWLQLTKRARIIFCTFLGFSLIYFLKLYGFPLLNFFDLTPVLKDLFFPKYLGVPFIVLFATAGLGLESFVQESTSLRNSIAAKIVALTPLATLAATTNYLTSNRVVAAFVYSLIVLLFVRFLTKSKWVTLGLAIAVIAMDLPSRIFSEPREVDRPVALYETLRERLGVNYRVFDARFYDTGPDATMPKQLAPYGIFDARDYSDSMSARYYELFSNRALRNLHWAETTLGSHRYSEFDHNLLSLFGVKYYIVDSGAEAVAGHIKSENLPIIENPQALSRTFLVGRVLVQNDSDQLLNSVTKDPLRLREVALVESDHDIQLPEIQNIEGATAEFKEQNFNSIRVSVAAPNGGFLVLLDQYYPGWKVFVNEVESKIYRTDYLFRGVMVPAGQSDVRFVYDPNSFKIGAIASLVSFLLFVGILTRRLKSSSSI
jgi:hypothetical protein